MNGQSICFKDAFFTFRCASCGDEKIVQVRCNLSDLRAYQCGFCVKKRKAKIVAKALSRYDKVKRASDQLVLWTVGTSLIDSEENRALIREMWKKFIRRMQYYIKKTGDKFDPLMNCMESGSKGNRLHYHIVARGYMRHKIMMDVWRDITEENSNVNFSKSFSNRSAKRAFAYLAKYASKGYGYYWMGSLSKAKFDEWEPEGDCNHQWTLGNVYSYGYRLQFQEKLQKYEMLM